MSRKTWNQAPYYDDYKSKKNFFKILFKPGRPVQARELNQIQSIFQNQIELFANHIFKNGSRVSNARASYIWQSFAKLDDISPWDNEEIDVNYFQEGMKVIGQTSNISATIVYNVKRENDDPPTIYFVYQSIAIDGETNTFILGEIIDLYDNNNQIVYSAKIRCPGCVNSNLEDNFNVLGKGSLFTIDEGVFYYEGLFIETARQSILVSKYGEKVDCKLGFDFIQEIITSDQDETILDNALGYPNSTAPGADRYKASLILTRRSLNIEDGDDFLLLATVEKGVYEYLKSDSEYSDIMDMIAKRTYETNGNFTVTPYKVRVIEERAKDTLDDLGYSVYGDPDYLRLVVSKGISYVKGYRNENQNDRFVRLFKARDTEDSASFIKRFDERTSINLQPLKGYSFYPNNASASPVIDNTIIDIYNGEFDGSNNPTGIKIGTMRVWDVNYVSGVINDITNPAIFKYYIYDLDIFTGYNINEAKSFVDSNTTNGFKARPESEDAVIVYNPGRTELLWKLQRENINSLRSLANNGTGSIQITLRKKLIGILNSNGSVTFTSATNEFFEEYDYFRTVAVIIDNDQGSGIARSINIAGKTSITTNSFILNLGTTINAGGQNDITTPGKTVCILHNVRRVNVTEYTKSDNYIQINDFNPNSNPFNVDKKKYLGITDAIKIDSVIAYDSTVQNDEGTDITSLFELVSNSKDSYYDESYLKYKGDIPSNQNIKWSIRVTYFEHNKTSHLGYYTIDSYRDLMINNVMSYDENPKYIASNKEEYPLFGCFDFRPDKTSSSFTGETIPAIGSTAVFDIKHYLGRIDLLLVDKTGTLYIKQGIPSNTPVPPKPDEDSMALYQIHLKPYTYSINDVSFKFIENKRYTMRDIGKLEERIKKVEYYTALSVLEKSSADMSIKDKNGLDRFKNGFVADNFQDYQAADLTSSDFRAALDRKGRELRPSFTPRNKKLTPIYDKSGCRFFGPMAMIDYESVVIDMQPFACKHISINPYFQFKRKGQMVLIPNMDVWADSKQLPELTVNVDTGAEELKKLADAGKLLGTHWGSWADMNKTIIEIDNNSTVFGTSITKGKTVTTITEQQREGTDISMGSKTTNYKMGNNVTDVALNPWMREIEITFVASKMKPNCKVYPFFDGRLVNEYVRPVKGVPGDELIVDSEGCITGIFRCPPGVFHTGDRKLLLSADKELTGDPDLDFTSAEAIFFSGGLDLTKQQTTMNVTTPTVNVKKLTETRTLTDVTSIPGTTLPPPPPPQPPPPPSTKPPSPSPPNPFNPPNPSLPPPEGPPRITVDTTEPGTKLYPPPWEPPREPPPPPPTQSPKRPVPPFLDTETPYTDLPKIPPPKNPSPSECLAYIQQVGRGYINYINDMSLECYQMATDLVDPVAQGIKLDQDHFITGLDIFFESVDEGGSDIFFELRTMDNGYPTTEVLTRKEVSPHILKNYVSNDSTIPFHCDFDFPVFLEGGVEYCFVVGGFSPDTRLWVSKLGMPIIDQPNKILETQPSIMSSYRSQNASTWNAEQFEDIKYVLYGARFLHKNMDIYFIHENEKTKLERDPFEGEQGNNRIRVYVEDHGLLPGDKVTLILAENKWIWIEIPPGNGTMQIGMNIRNPDSSFTGKIADYRYWNNRNYIKIENMKGTYSNGMSFICDEMDKYLDNNILLSKIDYRGTDILPSGNIRFNVVTGTFKENPQNNNYNGFNFEHISRQHTVLEVDSMDTFIIQVQGVTANQTGRFGGEDCAIYINEKYELFNVSGAYLPYGASENWQYSGILHNPPNGPFEAENNQRDEMQDLVLQQDNYLKKPHKVISNENDPSREKSIFVYGAFSTPNEWVSPVINSDSFSITTVSNRVEWMTKEVVNVAPNHMGRFLSESNPMNGSENYKYVTRTINLANPASDIMIAFDVYKDINADFDIWLKVLAPDELVDIDTKRWMRIVGFDKTYHSADFNDRIEYEITLSQMQLEVYQDNLNFQLLDWNVAINELSSFKVKIVGKAKNPALPPLFQSFRAIAVT